MIAQNIKNLLISLVCWNLVDCGAFVFFSPGDIVSRQTDSHSIGSMSTMSPSMVVSENSNVCFLCWARNVPGGAAKYFLVN